MLHFLVSLLFVASIASPLPASKTEGKIKKRAKDKLMRANEIGAPTSNELGTADEINLQPMRDCTDCWECYACTHDTHYGAAGNCVPILGCIPSPCEENVDCGIGRECIHGACRTSACSVTEDCDGNRKCYYGECRDVCTHSSDCEANLSGDICEHGLCVCSGSNC